MTEAEREQEMFNRSAETVASRYIRVTKYATGMRNVRP